MSSHRVSVWALMLTMFLSQAAPADESPPVNRFAALALACVHQEYPNKIAHVLAGDEDVAPPRQLTPVFYGCFDWHSSVHGHWLLVRLLRLYPDPESAAIIESTLNESFQAGKVESEVRYVFREDRVSFERPYGVAWLLQLTAELREWQDPRARQWLEVLQPLESALVTRMETWLKKLAYPIRIGEHAQTAFAFGLFLDWARAAGRDDFFNLVAGKSREFYLHDINCPMAYEPGGQDFLSPCLAEADLMRRILAENEFSEWLTSFLPAIPSKASEDWLSLAVVTDPGDGKLAHLDGLNLSRAWMLQGIASGLPDGDPRNPVIIGSANYHQESGLTAVTGEHYEGGHWLGSFATYLLTGRGLKAR